MHRSIRRGMLVGLLAIGSGAYAQPAPNPSQIPAQTDFEKGYQEIQTQAKKAFEDGKTFDVTKALKQLDDLGKLATADEKTKLAALRLALPKIEALRVPKASPSNPNLLDADYTKKVTALAPEFGADAAKAIAGRKLHLPGAKPAGPSAANQLSPEAQAARKARDSQALSDQGARGARAQASANNIIAGFGSGRSAEDITGGPGPFQSAYGPDAASGLHAADFNPKQKLAPSVEVPAAPNASQPAAAPTWWDQAKSLGNEYTAKAQNYAAAEVNDLKATGKELVAATVATGKQIGAATMTGLRETGTVLTTPLHGVQDSYSKFAAGRMAAAENAEQEGGALLEKGGVSNIVSAGWKAREAFADRLLAGDPKTVEKAAFGAAVTVAVVIAAPVILTVGATIVAGGTVAGAVVVGTTALVEGGLAAVTTYGVIHGSATLAKDPNIANAGLLAMDIIPIPFIGKIAEAAGKATGKVVEKAVTVAERNAGTSTVAAAVTGVVSTSAKSISKVEAAESKKWANKVAEKGVEKLTEKGIEQTVVEPTKDKIGELVAQSHEPAVEVREAAAEPAYGLLRGAFHPQLAMVVP